MDLVLGQYLRDYKDQGARIELTAGADSTGSTRWRATLENPAHNLAISSGAFTLQDALDYLTSKLVHYLCVRESARVNGEAPGEVRSKAPGND